MRLSLPFLACTIFAAATASTGCADQTSSEAVANGADQEVTSAETLLEAKVYERPNWNTFPSCDAYVRVTVSKHRDGGLSALLENKWDGDCEPALLDTSKHSFVTKIYNHPDYTSLGVAFTEKLVDCP